MTGPARRRSPKFGEFVAFVLTLVVGIAAFSPPAAAANTYTQSDTARSVDFTVGTASPPGCGLLAGALGFTYLYNLSSNGIGVSNSPSPAPVTVSTATNTGSIQSGTGQELDVALNNPGYIIQAVIVSNGGSYQAYTSPYTQPTLLPDQHYIAPFDNSSVPNITSWNICFTTTTAANYTASDPNRATFTNSSTVPGCSQLMGISYAWNYGSGGTGGTTAFPATNPITVAKVTNAGSVQPGIGQSLDVTLGNSLYVVQAVIVSNAGSYNVYSSGETPPNLGPNQNYIAPLDNTVVPAISTWNVCFALASAPATPEAPLMIALPLAGVLVLGAASLYAVRRKHRTASPSAL